MSVQMETGTVKTPSPFMEALYQAAKGGGLGVVVVTAVTPLLYAKNRLQTQVRVSGSGFKRTWSKGIYERNWSISW